MENLNILIVEDELIIAESLKLTLEHMGFTVTAIFSSGEEAVKKFKPSLADVIFMDIYLAGKITGIDAALQIKRLSDAPIIYLTKNEQKEIQKKAIHDTNPVHYITKPFSRQDISTAIDFAIRDIKIQTSLTDNNKEYGSQQKDYIFLKNGLGYKKIMMADIKYLKANGSYCEFFFKEGNHLFSENLRYFEEKFTFAPSFVRIHRSFIVNSDFIDRIHENRVWISGEQIPIGGNYKDELLERFRFI